MSNYEKDLIIGNSTLVLIIFLGAFLGSIVLDASIFIVLLSAIKSASWGYIIFLLLGILSMYRELTAPRELHSAIFYRQNYSQGFSRHRPIIIGCAIFVLFWIILLIPAYISGNEDALLDLVYVLMVGGSGLLLVFFMTFVGAVVARIL